MRKRRNIIIFTIIIFLLAINLVSADLKISGTYEMELKCNLQKDKEVDIWENDEKETVTIPYGIMDMDHNLWLNFNLTHPDNLYKGSFGIEIDMYNPEGKDYYSDITDIKKKKVSTFISYVDLTFFTKYFNSRLYKWRGHRESTDLLKLYKSDWDYNASRYLGIYSPVGIEFKGNNGTFVNGLFVGIGQTPSLINQSTIYLEYFRTFKFIESTLMYQQRTTPYLDLSDPDNILVYDINEGYAEGEFIYPQYPQTEYIYNERIIAFDNKIKTYYNSFQFEIAKYDASKNSLYYGAKLDTYIVPHFLNFVFIYENADKYAGNRKEYSIETRVTPVKNIIISAKYNERRPVYGPLFNNLLTAPLVYEHNREAYIYSGSIIFDPTPPTSLSHWNANFMEDAPIAVKCEYKYINYPTYTDNPVYFNWDENKYIIYGGDKGLYPCKLHNFSTKLISNYFSPYKIILYFNTSLKQARWPTYVAMVPWTENYSSYIELRKKDDFLIGLMCLIDDWEIPSFGCCDEVWHFKTNPYDYNRDIGIPWDYYLSIRTVKFLGKFSIELKYQYIFIDKDFNDKYENYMDAFQRRDMLKEEMNEISLICRIGF